MNPTNSRDPNNNSKKLTTLVGFSLGLVIGVSGVYTVNHILLVPPQDSTEHIDSFDDFDAILDLLNPANTKNYDVHTRLNAIDQLDRFSLPHVVMFLLASVSSSDPSPDVRSRALDTLDRKLTEITEGSVISVMKKLTQEEVADIVDRKKHYIEKWSVPFGRERGAETVSEIR